MRNERARNFRQADHGRRVVTFMRDADELISQAEKTDDFSGAWEQGDDTHDGLLVPQQSGP